MSIDASRLIIALDLPGTEPALKLVNELGPLGVTFKVGLELFMAGGPLLVNELASKYRVFLDLKFHDIPNTTAAAVREAAALGVWMINIHASGGKDMMSASREAIEGLDSRPLLTAVTVLTSMDSKGMAETGCPGSVADKVTVLSKLAKASGLDGVVCSPLDISAVKNAVSPRFITVTPGVRPIGAEADDQSRVASPAEAVRAGGDYLVVGRPITRAVDPLKAARAILDEMEKGYEQRKDH